MSFPFFGKEFVFTESDGNVLRLRGWGDQYRSTFETSDGDPVIVNPQTGFWEYADVAGVDGRPRPSGIRPRDGKPRMLALAPDLQPASAKRYLPSQLSRRHSRMRWQKRREQERDALASKSWLAGRQKKLPVGERRGLCLPIAFPDCDGQIDGSEIEAFCNKENYCGFGNKGSVYDYFLENSGGKLRFTNAVAPYYRARCERKYYTDPAAPYGYRAAELIAEALEYHKSQNYDFSRLSTDDDGYVYAVSAFYAGKNTSDVNKGLWAHQGALCTSIELAQEMWASDYLILDMGCELPLGTFCHEAGHLVCDFPDLYDDGTVPTSAGLGLYCLMSGGGATTETERNPTNICAYLKYKAGWADAPTVIADGLDAVAAADQNQFYLHRKSDTEYFIIENRQKTGRDAELPGSGLAILHVDALGDNSRPQRTSDNHYACTLVQADGNWDLETCKNQLGDATDLYHRDYKDRFDATSDPASTWWDGTASGLDIYDIGPSGPSMQFRARLQP